MNEKSQICWDNVKASCFTAGSDEDSFTLTRASWISAIRYLRGFKQSIRHSQRALQSGLTVNVGTLSFKIFHLPTDAENQM
jgi:hypothetical protein